MIVPKKILLVILDGIGEPLNGELPSSLEQADLTLLNWLARNGHTGLMENNLGERPDLGPDSGISTWCLLGYDKEEYPGRGWLDALGAGLKPKDGEVCLRANFSTVEEVPGAHMGMIPGVSKTAMKPTLKVVDRRAGRSSEGLHELAESIAKVNIEGMWVRFYRSLGHRGVALISSSDASPFVSDSDPGITGAEVPEIKPTVNDDKSVHTASTLNKWGWDIYNTLRFHPSNKHRPMPANFILLRDASIPKVIEHPFQDKHGLKAACIAASPVVRGMACALEMALVDVPGATGDLRTNLRDKTLRALDLLRTHDMVVLHILGTDVAGHDKNRREKVGFLTKVDKEVFGRIREYIDFKKNILVVASDHNTDVATGLHVAGKFPYAIYTDGIKPTGASAFNERAAMATGIDNNIEDLMELVMQFR
jgi:2,3-bisphosphoglycerate-independent phosphoglycerate mutase